MDKRYQVFISSTYEDLREERQKTIEAVLSCDCIPIGMEYFAAGDETQWALIKRVIAECDYYVVIVAGRYGSVDADGTSYTQKEYEFAVNQNIPVMAFLHGDPGKIPNEKSETDAGGKTKLEEFRNHCKGRICKDWTSPDGLAGQVAIALNQAKKTHPRVGWVRADKIADETATQEILQLRKRIDSLETELRCQKDNPPPGTEELAQGDQLFEFSVSIPNAHDKETKKRINRDPECKFSWNQLLSIIGECLIGPSGIDAVQTSLAKHIYREKETICGRDIEIDEYFYIKVPEHVVMTILLQFRALGIVEESFPDVKNRSTPSWKLTEYGDSMFTLVRAIRR